MYNINTFVYNKIEMNCTKHISIANSLESSETHLSYNVTVILLLFILDQNF